MQLFFEAESQSNTITTGTPSDGLASGGYVVGNIGGGSESVTFPVSVAGTGKRTLTIFYKNTSGGSNPNSSNAKIIVNNGTPIIKTLPSSAVFTSIDVEITLIDGANTIKFTHEALIQNTPYWLDKIGLTVLFGNVAAAATFTKSGCAAHFIGTTVEYTVPANKHHGDTQAAADQLALDDIAANGQTYADTNGICERVDFGNVRKSKKFSRTNCEADYDGSNVFYTIEADRYTAATQAEADQLALDDIAANGQNYANSAGLCIIKPTTPTPVILKPNFSTRNNSFKGTSVTGAVVKLYKNGVFTGRTANVFDGNFDFIDLVFLENDHYTVTASLPNDLVSAFSNDAVVVVMDSVIALTFWPLQLSRNRITAIVEPADPAAFSDRAKLKYLLNIYIQAFFNGSTFKDATTVPAEAAEYPPETSGSETQYRGAYFEIQEILDAYLQTTQPIFEQTGIWLCENLIRQFYCLQTVKNNRATVSDSQTDSSYVIKAGINNNDWTDWHEQLFTNITGKAGQFLTWTENPKKITGSAPELLYFLNNISPTPSELHLRLEVVYEDGSVEKFNKSDFYSVNKMAVYGLAVGPVALGISSLPKVVLKYSVWLNNELDQRVSEVRKYDFDPLYYRNIRHIVFGNSLGAFDVFTFLGQGSQRNSYSKQAAERYNRDYEPTFSEKVINKVTNETELTLYTQYLTKAQRRYLQELLISREVFVQTDRKLLPLTIVTADYVSEMDDEDIIGRQVVFRYANPVHNASFLPSPSVAIKRTTIWQAVGFSCELDENGRYSGKKIVHSLQKYYADTLKAVFPVTIKPNLSGTDGYILPSLSTDCAHTPFVSIAKNKTADYKKDDCGTDQIGDIVTLYCEVGRFGSTISQADADAKAATYLQSINTQSYANANGACIAALTPVYTGPIPQGHFHYWTNEPSFVGIARQQAPPAPFFDMGNDRGIGVTGANIYAAATNHLDFPNAGSYVNWWIIVNNLTNVIQTKRVRIYINEVLKIDETLPIGINNRNWYSLVYYPATGWIQLQNQDKVFVKID